MLYMIGWVQIDIFILYIDDDSSGYSKKLSSFLEFSEEYQVASSCPLSLDILEKERMEKMANR